MGRFDCILGVFFSLRFQYIYDLIDSTDERWSLHTYGGHAVNVIFGCQKINRYTIGFISFKFA
jgi:hypothetical protein